MPGRARPTPPRRLPTRSCVACRTARPKRELVRVVRTPAGTIQADLTGRAAGRGAYLCNDPACWELAVRKRALEHALRAPIPFDIRTMLTESNHPAGAPPAPEPDTDGGERSGKE